VIKTAKPQHRVTNSLADIGQYLSSQMQERLFYKVSKTEGRIKIGTQSNLQNHTPWTQCQMPFYFTLLKLLTITDVRRGRWCPHPTTKIQIYYFCGIRIIFEVCFPRLPWCVFCTCAYCDSPFCFTHFVENFVTFVNTNTGLYLPNYLLHGIVALQSLSTLPGIFM